jgi:hypothetical protein
MMADNWSFVIAAYGFAVVVLAMYWRFLVRRERELDDAGVVRQQPRRAPGVSSHAQIEPGSRSPLP